MLLFLSGNVLAEWTNGNQAVEATIWRTGYHGFYVTSSNYHDPEGCTTTKNGNMYLFSPEFEISNEKLTDRLFSIILTAQTSGKKLHVFVEGCVGQYPKITGLQLNN